MFHCLKLSSVFVLTLLSLSASAEDVEVLLQSIPIRLQELELEIRITEWDVSSQFYGEGRRQPKAGDSARTYLFEEEIIISTEGLIPKEVSRYTADQNSQLGVNCFDKSARSKEELFEFGTKQQSAPITLTALSPIATVRAFFDASSDEFRVISRSGDEVTGLALTTAWTLADGSSMESESTLSFSVAPGDEHFSLITGFINSQGKLCLSGELTGFDYKDWGPRVGLFPSKLKSTWYSSDCRDIAVGTVRYEVLSVKNLVAEVDEVFSNVSSGLTCAGYGERFDFDTRKMRRVGSKEGEHSLLGSLGENPTQIGRILLAIGGGLLIAIAVFFRAHSRRQ